VSGPEIVPAYGTGAVTAMLSDTFGSGAASSAATAPCVNVYVIVFVAPVGIVTLPLSALA
jgi:hypothetical protein